MIYFDYTATTKPSEELLDLHKKVNSEYWYNSEALYLGGIKSNTLVEKSEKLILDTLKLKNKKVLFTSGATEANNTAISGICKPYIKSPKHIITTKIEHASVLNCFKYYESIGFKVTYLNVNKEGLIDPNELLNALTPDTILVSIMWVNNIIGTVEPINEVINILKNHNRAKLHIDAVQGIGKLKINFDLNSVDLITISGHKINGIKGTGALIYNDKLTPQLLLGGHQQYTLRPGTVDVAGCVTLSKALEKAINTQEKSFNTVLPLYNYLLDGLKDLSFININRSLNSYSPFILSVTFKKIKGETVLHMLEAKDMYVSTGSACNSKAKSKEETLKNILDDESLSINTIRISLSKETTIEELDKLINEIKRIGAK